MNNTQVCYSRGSILAKLMIIGQSPGKMEVTNIYNDSKTNRAINAPVPFVGPAGILLMSLLKWLDIREGEYIMTNTIQYLPLDPNGRIRPPSEQELIDNRQRLFDEIVTIKPKLIFAFGKEAAWNTAYYLEKPLSLFKITAMNGKLKDVTIRSDLGEHDTKVLTLFHPSYLRRLQLADYEEYKVKAKLVSDALIKHRTYIEQAINRQLLLNS